MSSRSDQCGAIRQAGSAPCVRRPGHELSRPGVSRDLDDELHEPGDGGDPWREIPVARPSIRVAADVATASQSITLPYVGKATSGHLVTVEPAGMVRVCGRMVPTVRFADRLFAATEALDLSAAIPAVIYGVRRPALVPGERVRCSRTVRPLADGAPVQVRMLSDHVVLVSCWPFGNGDALLLSAAIAAAVHRQLNKATCPTCLDSGYAGRVTSTESDADQRRENDRE